VHEGGYILPGLQMMRESLLAGTGRIRFEQDDFSSERHPGRSTAEAVLRGATHGAASVIECSLRDCEKRWKQKAELWLTGGNGQLVLNSLQGISSNGWIFYKEDLVMDGLQYVDFSIERG